MIERFVARCVVTGLLVLSPGFAFAQTPASPAEVSAFQANPGQMMSEFPNGGSGLSDRIKGLLGADKSTLGTIIGLARTANEDQRKTMAEALAAVAKAYASNDPAFANQVQQAVASSGIPEFARAYAEAAGDTGTAAAGGGGGGTGGGGPNTGGAPTGGQNTSANSSNSNSVTTQTTGLSGGDLGSATFSEVSDF